MIEKGTKIESDGESIMVGRIRQRKESWRIVGIYVGESIERILERLRRWGRKGRGKKIREEWEQMERRVKRAVRETEFPYCPLGQRTGERKEKRVVA